MMNNTTVGTTKNPLFLPNDGVGLQLVGGVGAPVGNVGSIGQTHLRSAVKTELNGQITGGTSVTIGFNAVGGRMTQGGNSRTSEISQDAKLEIWGNTSPTLSKYVSGYTRTDTTSGANIVEAFEPGWVLLGTVSINKTPTTSTVSGGPHNGSVAYDLQSYSVTITAPPGMDITNLAFMPAFPTNQADTHTILIDDISTLAVCFGKGTMIESIAGKIAIEDVKPGDILVTRDGGMSPVKWLGKSQFTAKQIAENPNLYPVRIKAGALGDDMPDEDLLVSQQHRVLIKGPLVKKMFGEDEILTKAKNLIGYPGIELVEIESEVDYYHLMLEQHEVVYSNNAPTESFYPGPEALKAVGDKARGELIKVLGSSPEHTAQTKMPFARPVPEKEAKVRKIVLRLQKNGKPLMVEDEDRIRGVGSSPKTDGADTAKRPTN